MKWVAFRQGVILLFWWMGVSSVGWCEAPPNGEPSVPYQARVKGLWFGELKRAVQEQSLTISLVRHPPATIRQLRKRAEDDLPSMTAALKASGHLAATLELEMETNRVPVRVTFRVHKGPLYKIGDFRVNYAASSEDVPPIPSQLGWNSRSAASVEQVEAAEEAALHFLQTHGFLKPKILKRDVIREDIHKRVDVVCTVDPGASATLGIASLHGLVRLQPEVVRNRVSWAPGNRYDIEELKTVEKELLRSGLFSIARTTVLDEPDGEGNLPVRVDLVERARRTFRAGVSYYTDEGFGGQTSWENRNLFGHAEKMALTLTASEILYEGKIGYSRPDLFAKDLDLHVEESVSDEHPDAYQSRKWRSSLWLEKRVWHQLTLKGGVAYELDRVEEKGEESRFGLGSLPLSAGWDLRDDPLDPFRGANFYVSTTPYLDTGADLTFLKTWGEASVYVPLSSLPRMVLASRLSLGTITGDEAVNVPADKRFYAGGGGTIRGYKYQSVGEWVNGEPAGGKSMATVSAEWRVWVTSKMGLAFFMDGGTTYPDSQPNFDTPFLWGAGGGVRYYLGFAPLRMDIAFPLQAREGVDDDFQLYISLGQSF